MTALDEVIKQSRVVVHLGRYAYLKANKVPEGNHFLITHDQDEITVVTEEKNVNSVSFSASEKWFKLIEVKVSVPFYCVGFIAKTCQAIADMGVNVLAVSTYSKDYFLVREEELQKTVTALGSIGFKIND